MSTAGEASSSRSVLLPSEPFAPAPILATDENVGLWPSTPGFKGFWGWIQWRCDRIRGRPLASGPYEGSSVGVQRLLRLLDEMTGWVSEAPPEPQQNQRFGNLAFRKYMRLADERLPALLKQEPSISPTLVEQILPLLVKSTPYGHPTRLDYGTGHELAFVLALWCCVASGWIRGEDEEDELILRVFPRYLELTTLLQKTYNLEPAGSHGVWGLDDYCFLPYLFGSAQLLGSDLTPTQSLERALSLAQNPTSAPPDDLYTLSLWRVTQFKSGAAFSEHSPLLHSLSLMPNWTKPHQGLRKMFLGEVVGKRVVVQGLWLGGWCWGETPPRNYDAVLNRDTSRKEHSESRTITNSAQEASTKAPWAR